MTSTNTNSNIGADDTAMIIVDHGSKREESNEMLLTFVEMFIQKTKCKIVEPAHMELAEPSIATAFDRCVERGAKRVVVMPYFLSPGKHWLQDIPAITKAAAESHPGVGFMVGAPIGLHDLMVDLIQSRFDHCVSHASGNTDECENCKGLNRCQMVGEDVNAAVAK